MTPEESFLVRCVRRFVGTADEAGFAGQASEVDEQALTLLAQVHGVLALLPTPPEAELKEQIRSNLVLTGELLRLLAVFEAEGIRVVPVKGPILAESVYGDIGLRSFHDLDLLIDPADRGRACQLLTRNGYRLTSKLPWPNSFRSKEDELTFHRTSSRAAVDLHWDLIPAYYFQPVHPERLWNQLKTVTFAGRSVAVLGDEDLLIFLCVHGAKHGFGRLNWICDIARLIQVRHDLDWPTVLSKAREQRCGRVVLVGIAVVSEVLGTALPPGVIRMISGDSVVSSRTAMVRNRLFGGSVGAESPVASIGFNLPLFETLGGRLRYLHGMILAPTEAEFSVLQLPPWMYWVYYPFRALRLIWALWA